MVVISSVSPLCFLGLILDLGLISSPPWDRCGDRERELRSNLGLIYSVDRNV